MLRRFQYLVLTRLLFFHLGNKKNDYWEPAKRELLSDTKFLETLQAYDKDNVSPAIVEKIMPIYQNPDFEASRIAKASKAAESLCKWVRAMVLYDKVFRVSENCSLGMSHRFAS